MYCCLIYFSCVNELMHFDASTTLFLPNLVCLHQVYVLYIWLTNCNSHFLCAFMAAVKGSLDLMPYQER